MDLMEFLKSNPLVLYGAGGLLAVVVLVVLVRLLARRPPQPLDEYPDLSVDVARLDRSGPPDSEPRVEVYGVPVRLAVLVLAPVGRDGELPAAAQLGQLLDNFLPNFQTVLAEHRPMFRSWPGQLSTQGFRHAFFNNLSLPGDRGKSTPWCTVAGKFSAGGKQYLVGMLFCAASPNALSEAFVEHEGQWLDVVRIRTG